MAADTKIQEFIGRAKTAGVPEPSVLGMLTARGWPEKDIYAALAAHYEQATGLQVPGRESTATAAKDAFFYLLIFSTLATWTIGLGALAFTLIDRWLADTLFLPYSRGWDMYSAAESMASVLVAFPIFLLISRSVLHDEALHPEKLTSPVRKWLTYMALVIAASIFIGDLIAALTYFLRGEITSRFLAKVFVVLVISGGIFYYYFGGLKRSESLEVHTKTSRNKWMACVSVMAVASLLLFGFSYTGAPNRQRALRADERRVQDLYQLTVALNNRWKGGNHKLPEHLDEIPNAAFADPITRVAYEYHVKEGSQYELCAIFTLASPNDDSARRTSTWGHSKGRHCFAFDASQIANSPAYSRYY
jgi:hypothetical protein